MSRLCGIVLTMEAIVIALTIVPAVKLGHASAGTAGLAGGVAALVAVALAALARRRLRWTLIGGSLLQVLIIVSGSIISVMYILGVIFGILWVVGIWLGHRVETSA